MERNLRSDAVTTVGSRAHAKITAVGGDPLLHAHQAVAGRRELWPRCRRRVLVTSTVTASGPTRTSTLAVAPSPACFTTLVNASCATR